MTVDKRRILIKYTSIKVIIVIYVNLRKHQTISKRKILLESKLEELKSENIDSKKETDIVILDEEGLLKVYVKSLIDKIIVSRSGEIEIVEK